MGLLNKILNRTSTKDRCDTESTQPCSEFNGLQDEQRSTMLSISKQSSMLQNNLNDACNNFTQDPLTEYQQVLCQNDKKLFKIMKDIKAKKKRHDKKKESMEVQIHSPKGKSWIYSSQLKSVSKKFAQSELRQQQIIRKNIAAKKTMALQLLQKSQKSQSFNSLTALSEVSRKSQIQSPTSSDQRVTCLASFLEQEVLKSTKDQVENTRFFDGEISVEKRSQSHRSQTDQANLVPEEAVLRLADSVSQFRNQQLKLIITKEVRLAVEEAETEASSNLVTSSII